MKLSTPFILLIIFIALLLLTLFFYIIYTLSHRSHRPSNQTPNDTDIVFTKRVLSELIRNARGLARLELQQELRSLEKGDLESGDSLIWWKRYISSFPAPTPALPAPSTTRRTERWIERITSFGVEQQGGKEGAKLAYAPFGPATPLTGWNLPRTPETTFHPYSSLRASSSVLPQRLRPISTTFQPRSSAITSPSPAALSYLGRGGDAEPERAGWNRWGPEFTRLKMKQTMDRLEGLNEKDDGSSSSGSRRGKGERSLGVLKMKMVKHPRYDEEKTEVTELESKATRAELGGDATWWEGRVRDLQWEAALAKLEGEPFPVLRIMPREIGRMGKTASSSSLMKAVMHAGEEKWENVAL